MIDILVTLVLTLVLGGVLFALFRWVKVPYYRVDTERMIHVLEMVLTGQATENDWNMTFGMVIRHQPDLEEVRQTCVLIEEKYYSGNTKPPYLFSPKGLAELESVLQQLKSNGV
ncbi:MAG: hypothetical protein ACRBCI_03965 [Cellvibrionaceae bacterium]